MHCISCSSDDTKVLESRVTLDGRSIRRRRACRSCDCRFTTYEREEDFLFNIRKQDNKIEPYQRAKAIRSIRLACQKRNIALQAIKQLVTEVELEIRKIGETTIASTRLGDLILERLPSLDSIAYIRFASVYRSFKDVNEFMVELKEVLKSKDASNPPEQWQ